MGGDRSETGNAKWSVAGKHVEIIVAVEHRSTRAYRNRGNQTVHQFADGLSAVSAKPVRRGGLFMVHRFRRNNSCPSQQAPKTVQVSFAPRARRNLHANRITDGNLLAEQPGNVITCR